MSQRSSLIRADAIAAMLSTLLVSQVASARDRHTSTTGPNGKTVERQSTCTTPQ